jgi:hypothetical protein
MNINIVIAIIAVLLLVAGCVWFHSRKSASTGTVSPTAPAAPPAPGNPKFPRVPTPVKDQ